VRLQLCAACAWGGVVYTFEPSLCVFALLPPAALSGQPRLVRSDWQLRPGGGSYSTGQVYSYASTGVPVAPGGGAQFVAMVGPGTSNVHSGIVCRLIRWAITMTWAFTIPNPDYMAGSIEPVLRRRGQFQAVATLNSDST